MNSIKSSENIQKTEGGLISTVSNNQFSSVTLNELAMKARDSETIILNFREAVNRKTNTNPNGVKIAQICLEYMSINL